MVGAAIIAGGIADEPLFAVTQVREKALVEINGRPMLDYVIEAVTSCPAIGEAVIACPSDFEVARRDWGGIPHTATDGADPIDSIAAGVGALTHSDRVLICACDLPLLTSAAVGEFVAEGLEAETDCCYPMLSEQVIEAEFPGCPRTYQKFRDGRYTSGNIALVAREFVIDHRDSIHEAFALRKSPLRMAALLGPLTVLGLVVGLSSIDNVAKRAARVLGCTVTIVRSQRAELAFDVDKPRDLELAREALVQRATSR